MQCLVTLGENVRAYRKLRGLTQEKLGELAGIDRSYIGAIERTAAPSVTVSHIEMIAKALNVPLAFLYMKNSKFVYSDAVSDVETSNYDFAKRDQGKLELKTRQNSDVSPNESHFDYVLVEKAGSDMVFHSISIEDELEDLWLLRVIAALGHGDVLRRYSCIIGKESDSRDQKDDRQ